MVSTDSTTWLHDTHPPKNLFSFLANMSGVLIIFFQHNQRKHSTLRGAVSPHKTLANLRATPHVLMSWYKDAYEYSSLLDEIPITLS